MPRHVDSKKLPYSASELFDLVADVQRYPDFLPWVMGARVQSRADDLLVADLIVGFKIFREKFTSRVRLSRPTHIHVDYVNGPLKYLHNDWRFEEDTQGWTTIHFVVDFEFKSRLFETMVGALFSEAVKRMVNAFEARAISLYGLREAPLINSASATRTVSNLT
jgi:coenzyme Q-binding protein COQ10